jgi:preprotein translocase subunit YajC
MPEQAASPGVLELLIPFGGMFFIFYFLVFRPQAKAQRQHEAMLKNLKKNDQVVTRGGLIGTVVNIKDQTLTLRLNDTVRVDVERSAVERLWQMKEAESTGGQKS